jgi:hypothetical protein
MRRTARSPCCECTTSGHVAALPANVMKSRRRISHAPQPQNYGLKNERCLQYSKCTTPNVALGQERPICDGRAMSALSPIVASVVGSRCVRFGPEAAIPLNCRVMSYPLVVRGSGPAQTIRLRCARARARLRQRRRQSRAQTSKRRRGHAACTTRAMRSSIKRPIRLARHRSYQLLVSIFSTCRDIALFAHDASNRVEIRGELSCQWRIRLP